MKVLLFLLLVFSASGWAESNQPVTVDNTQKKVEPMRDPTRSKVYSKKSQLTVDKINKTVEVLRDPTAMSGNFRKALRGLQGNHTFVDESGATPANAKDFGLPEIEIVGRVYSENKPATVVLKANGKYHHFVEGDRLTRVINNQLVTFHVQEINEHSVRLLVMPFNKILIFN